MLLELNTTSRQQIPSFQSIDFKLSENLITSRNPSLSEYNDYEPGSLTYTQTQPDERNSMKFIDFPDCDKQNFNNIQILLNNHRQKPLFKGFRQQQDNQKLNNIQMRRKKSALFVKNLQLHVDQSGKNEAQTKRSHNSITSKSIQKRNSFSRNKQVSIPSISHNASIQHPDLLESIVVVSNISINKSDTQDTECSSLIRKRSISCLKTEDRSTISSIARSCSNQRLKRSESVRNSLPSNQRIRKIRTISDRSSKNTIQRNPSKDQIKNQRLKNIKRNQFLQDPIPLQTIINVKSIKLEQNTDVSRAYLRKIIQNRVSIQHYAQNNKNCRQIRQ